MLIEINDNDFNQMLKIVKQRNTTLYNKLKDLTPLDNLNQVNTLTIARTVKTERTKESIKKALIDLIGSNITPTKYKVHKSTNIAYTTLKKYYDEILQEVQDEH
jgi:hypothetical protein